MARLNEFRCISVDRPGGGLSGGIDFLAVDDPCGSLDTGHAAAELMPEARLEIVGIGHLPWWDEPGECARLVREFVRPVEPR